VQPHAIDQSADSTHLLAQPPMDPHAPPPIAPAEHIEPVVVGGAGGVGPARIQIRKLRKEYDNGTVAVQGLDLDMYDNQITALLGKRRRFFFCLLYCNTAA
jgi:hypothetical protein